MTVTAIITTFQRSAAMLKRAIDSVATQTCASLELIVVDDNAPGYPESGAIEALVRQEARIPASYIRHERNMGACAARNTGIAHAAGTYVAFLDDDDEWLPAKIERQLCVFEANPALGLVYCGWYVVDDRRKTQKNLNPATRFHRGRVFDQLLCDNFIGSNSFPLIKKACFSDCGSFCPEQRSSQDYEQWLRIAKRYPVDFVEEPLCLYHVHSGDRISGDPKKKIQGFEYIMRLYRDDLRSNPKARSCNLLRIAQHYAGDGQAGRALGALLAAFTAYPRNAKTIAKKLGRSAACFVGRARGRARWA